MPARVVLLVDDEPDIRTLGEIALAEVGAFEVRTASSGAAALAAARAAPPDAIVLDFMLPDMEGPEVLAALRGDPRTAGIPVVFLTAKAGHAQAAALRAQGALGVLAKPFSPMTLASELAALLDGAAAPSGT